MWIIENTAFNPYTVVGFQLTGNRLTVRTAHDQVYDTSVTVHSGTTLQQIVDSHAESLRAVDDTAQTVLSETTMHQIVDAHAESLRASREEDSCHS